MPASECRITTRVIRSVAKRHEDNSGNREPLAKMERSDILANVSLANVSAYTKSAEGGFG